MKLTIPLILTSLILQGCLNFTTPERYTKSATYSGLTTQTLTMTYERGPQLWFGARNDVISTKNALVVSQIDKTTMGTTIGALAGLALGLSTGQPIVGAAVGTTAGVIQDTVK